MANTAAHHASKPSQAGKKKKGKDQSTANSAPAPVSKTPSDAGAEVNGHDVVNESSYIKELQKDKRNLSKRINATSKTESIIADNPGKSLDELVAEKKINADQKASILKKPALVAQLAQLDEQAKHFQSFAEDIQRKFEGDKEKLATKHKQEVEQIRDTEKAQAEAEAAKVFKKKLLVLSRFLREAASRRQSEDDDQETSKAFEGALLLVYGGDMEAVGAVVKLIDGTDDPVPSTEGELLNVTFGQIKQAALEGNPINEDWENNNGAAELDVSGGAGAANIATDPTIAHAGLTELDALPATSNGGDNIIVPTGVSPSDPTPEAANNAAIQNWDNKTASQEDLEGSFEMVPRNPSEVDTPVTSATGNIQSWADDHPVENTQAAPKPAAVPANDGFHEVHHGRGGRGRANTQGDFRGGYRGRGGNRGDGRGRGGFRGGRGEYRGRGRGGHFRGNQSRDGAGPGSAANNSGW